MVDVVFRGVILRVKMEESRLSYNSYDGDFYRTKVTIRNPENKQYFQSTIYSYNKPRTAVECLEMLEHRIISLGSGHDIRTFLKVGLPIPEELI